jgi:hypothetical protein
LGGIITEKGEKRERKSGEGRFAVKDAETARKLRRQEVRKHHEQEVFLNLP